MDIWFWVWLLTVLEFIVAFVVKDSRCDSEDKAMLFLLPALLVADVWGFFFLSSIEHYIPKNLVNPLMLAGVFFAITFTIVFGLWLAGLNDCWSDRR